jgi:hypothetical protein
MKNIKFHLVIFSLVLILSGVTAFPIQTEFELATSFIDYLPSEMSIWYKQVASSIKTTSPVMFYGTDWLAFAHIVIALFFIPVYLEPTQYKLNLKMAQIACVGVFPLAHIAGNIRGIPWFHQVIDCSFGVFGFIYLCYIERKINELTSGIKNQ